MKIAILGFCTHPDSIACAAGGFILRSAHQGEAVVVVSVTKGLPRSGQAADAFSGANVLSGMAVIESLHLEECVRENGDANRLEIIRLIRRYRPKIVLANAIKNCHPERSRISKLISEACFLSGLPNLSTSDGAVQQEPWRPEAVYHYIRDHSTGPDLVVDISAFFEEKLRRVGTAMAAAAPADPDGPVPVDLMRQIENVNRH